MKISMLLKTAALSLDGRLAWTSGIAHQEQGSLLSFTIHGLFANKDEAHSGLVDPQQGFTIAMLREFLAHFTHAGYRFLSPPDLGAALSPRGKYALLTFDDGYYNNVRALPVLEEFNVPAVFFISAHHVKYGKAFWWDAVHRQAKRRGWPEEELRRRVDAYKCQKPAQIEADIVAHFGKAALRPAGDLDRPFTAAELNRFAAHPLIFLGNHTADHAILTNCSSAAIREQIFGCQAAVLEMTGKTPQLIAYPNGNWSPEVSAAAREAGLQFGLLTVPGRNRLPLPKGSEKAMTLRRFTLCGDCPVETQCLASRSWFSLYRLLRSVKKEPALFPADLKSLGNEKSLARSAGS